jgi:hypothetical protein
MGGKSQPAPDYSGMEALGREQLQFARDQYADIKPLATRIADQQMAAQAQQMQQAQDYYNYQRDTFRPLEQGLVRDAQNFNTEAYRTQMAQKAAADVQQAFQGAQSQSNREMARRGINPNSTAAISSMNANALRLASATAGAQTGARDRAEQMGYARRLEVTGLGRGLSGAANAAYSGATGAGTAGLASSMAPGSQAMTGMAQAGQTMGTVLNNQTSQFNAGLNAEGQVMGALAGAATTYGLAKVSDRRLKENIELVGRDERTMLPLYEFEYKGGSGRRFLGVMAQDVAESYPDMVFTMPDGFMAVNYAGLGIEMVEV